MASSCSSSRVLPQRLSVVFTEHLESLAIHSSSSSSAPTSSASPPAHNTLAALTIYSEAYGFPHTQPCRPHTPPSPRPPRPSAPPPPAAPVRGAERSPARGPRPAPRADPAQAPRTRPGRCRPLPGPGPGPDPAHLPTCPAKGASALAGFPAPAAAARQQSAGSSGSSRPGARQPLQRAAWPGAARPPRLLGIPAAGARPPGCDGGGGGGSGRVLPLQPLRSRRVTAPRTRAWPACLRRRRLGRRAPPPPRAPPQRGAAGGAGAAPERDLRAAAAGLREALAPGAGCKEGNPEGGRRGQINNAGPGVAGRAWGL